MLTAIWNGAVLAEAPADQCERIEGNWYFPPASLKRDYFKDSDHHTTCGWKGVASYYTVVVNGQENPNAAWYYPEPKDAAQNIKGYVAFWKGVQVQA